MRTCVKYVLYCLNSGLKLPFERAFSAGFLGSGNRLEKFCRIFPKVFIFDLRNCLKIQ